MRDRPDGLPALDPDRSASEGEIAGHPGYDGHEASGLGGGGGRNGTTAAGRRGCGGRYREARPVPPWRLRRSLKSRMRFG